MHQPIPPVNVLPIPTLEIKTLHTIHCKLDTQGYAKQNHYDKDQTRYVLSQQMIDDLMDQHETNQRAVDRWNEYTWNIDKELSGFHNLGWTRWYTCLIHLLDWYLIHWLKVERRLVEEEKKRQLQLKLWPMMNRLIWSKMTEMKWYTGWRLKEG